MTGRVAQLSVAIGLGLAGVIVAWQATGWHATDIGGDAWNYLAAGERLNAGHPLYALGPGDRVVPLSPPYWSVPLMAPPPIAVLWRPLATLGEPMMSVWALMCLAAVASAAWLLRGRALVLGVLTAPLALTALSGNASALVLLGLIGTWAMRDRPVGVGALVAAMAAVKLTPALLVVWLVMTRRWWALAATLSVGLTIVLASALLAGPAAWGDWLASVPQSAPSPLAVASWTGLPTWVVAGLAVAAVLGVWIGTRDERWTFAAAVIGTALATPALYFQALALLPAATAPWALTPRTSPGSLPVPRLSPLPSLARPLRRPAD